MPKLIVDSDTQISIGMLADTVLGLYGSKLAFYTKKRAVSNIRHSYAATEKAQNLLTHQPTHTLNQGLQSIISSSQQA